MNERQERLGAVGVELRSQVSGKLGDVWWTFMLRGVLAGMLGIFALFWPTASFTILTRVVGLYCLADGLSGLLGAPPADRGASLSRVVAGLVVGGVLVFWPGTSVRTLLMVFGAWACCQPRPVMVLPDATGPAGVRRPAGYGMWKATTRTKTWTC
jgi:uncharacterized membrane protein HdeD (DUF308 family)